MLVKGIWQENWQPVQAKDEQGRFIRQTSSFRNWITPDGAPRPTGSGGFKAEAGRYQLYVAYIFDAAYHGLFKCNRNTLRAMRGLHAYMRRILTLDGIANTVRIDHIKAGYYSIKALNPSGIVPAGPGEF